MSRLELKIPPVGVLLVMGAASWAAGRVDVARWIVEMPLVASAIALGAVGCVIAFSGVLSFRQSKTTVDPINPDKASTLVTSGIFRLTRNPMYLGMQFVLLGWSLFLGGLLPLIMALAFIPYMTRFQIVPEERVMRTLFGEEYERYCQRVRRWM